jgi:hypothetical protein
MSLTETKEIDRVEVVGNGIVQVREATTILKDGIEYAKTFHRWSFAPESDISAMPANVQAIAQAAWTPEVIAAYKAQVEANRRGVPA